MSEVVVVSNRGPLKFSRQEDGELVGHRGAGGLVSSLSPLLAGTGAVWIAAAMDDDDRAASRKGLVEADGLRLRSLDIDPATYRMAYDVVSNATLWFVYHGLFDLTRRPRIDRRWWQAWTAYQAVNEAFAEAVADTAPEGATVLIQDFHLTLVGAHLAHTRPDLAAVHFTHTPFCDPTGLRALPDAVAEELLHGLDAHVACGFHAERWAAAFRDCCTQVLGREPTTFVAPLGPDPDDLTRVAGSDACRDAVSWLDGVVGDRRLVLRVDRVEPSKNLLRGFLAFDELLGQRPDLRGKVVFLALVYPSREGLPEYLAYRTEMETLADRVNQKWCTPGWDPVVLAVSDNYPRSVAALARYDVLLVNPIRDGLNLVAKEGALLNATDGLLVLSREAGAWPELAGGAIGINPFDVSDTADALARALDMEADERRALSATVREAAGQRTPRDWLDDQLAAAGDHQPG